MKTTIHLNNLEVECLIGCLDPERAHTQPIIVDIAALVEGQEAADTDKVSQAWNYADVAAELSFILHAGRFHLLESAALFLLKYLLMPPLEMRPTRPKVEWAKISLTKSKPLPGQTTAKVEMEASASEFSFFKKQKAWGFIDVVHENKYASLYRLSLNPGCEIPIHYHQQTREQELVLTKGLVGLIDDHRDTKRSLDIGESFSWEKGQKHGYINSPKQAAGLLSMNIPPFDSNDEIVVA